MAASSGFANTWRTDSAMPWLSFMRTHSRVASSESPPSSKKWSHRSTLGSDSRAHHSAASACSAGVAGGWLSRGTTACG